MTDIWVSFVAAFFVLICEKAFKSMTWNFMYSISKVQENEAQKLADVNKMCKKMFATVYFAIVTIYGYYVLSQTEYLPKFLGGKEENSLANLWTDFPVITKPYAS